MANQELVAYLRKHWQQYSQDTLRQKLISEGLDENEINAAMAEVATKTGKKPSKATYAVFSAIILIVFILLNLRHGSDDAQQNASGAKPTLIHENQSDPHQAFLGHYGYVVRLPLGYSALSDFKDPEKTIEDVYIFPKGSDLNNLSNENLYGSLNILRLEVSPRRVPLGRLGLTAIRGQVTASLQQSRISYSMRETIADGLQVLVVNIQGSAPKTQAFVVGNKVVYVLTGGSENQLFTDILLSLHESGNR